jgi:[ribosomal protein S18]-alanine N-acetyltransferase
MSLIVRRMTVEDVQIAHEIDTSSFTLPWPERSFRFEVTDNPASRCWAAELDGQVVGILILWMILDEAHIATLATHPAHRRKGIAEQLLITALNKAYEEGARSALLEVRAGNVAAQTLYHKFGFEEVGTRKRYYKDNDEDAVLMTLERLPVVPLSHFESSELG